MDLNLATWGGRPNGDRITVVVHPGGHLYPTAQSPRVVAFLEAHPLP